MRASIGTPHPMQAQTIYPTNAYMGGGSAAQGGYQADFQERAATPTQLNGQRMATPIQPDGQRVGEMNAHAASFEPSVAPGGRPHEEANEAGAQPAAPRPQPTTHQGRNRPCARSAEPVRLPDEVGRQRQVPTVACVRDERGESRRQKWLTEGN